MEGRARRDAGGEVGDRDGKLGEICREARGERERGDLGAKGCKG